MEGASLGSKSMSDATGGHPVVTEPIAVAASGTGWPDVAAVLKVFNFRLVLASTLSGSVAGWMARVAIDWLLLELTGNVALVGLAVTFQFAPILLFGAWAGVLSDRFSRHRIVLGSQTVMWVCLGLLSLLTLLQAVELWHVYLLAVVQGLAQAAEGPARSALVTQVVPAGRIRTAISLNAGAFHLGALLGPALSGALVAMVGSGWSIAASLVLIAVSFASFAAMRRRELSPVPRAGSGAGVRDAIRYARRKPTIFWPMVLLAVVATFGMTHPVLFTAAASDAGFATGSTGYGLYMSIAALGAVAGAVLSARRRTVRLRGIVLSILVFGVALVVAAVTWWVPVFLVAIVVFSTGRLLFGTGAESMVQVSSNPAIRGRIAALYFVILTGGQAIGSALIGGIAQTVGVPLAFAVAGGVPLVAAAVIAIVLARRHELTVQVDLRRPSRFLRIVRRGQPRSGSRRSRSRPSQRSPHSIRSAPRSDR